MAPSGMSLALTSPAFFGIEVVPAGMLNTTQCQKPLPVGASGSKLVMAKLLVPLGAPLQLKDGEILPPLQPKPNSALSTCSSAMAPPSVTSALFTVMFCAYAGAPSALKARTAAPIGALIIALSLDLTGHF